MYPGHLITLVGAPGSWETAENSSPGPRTGPSMCRGLRCDGGFSSHSLLNVDRPSGMVSALPTPAVWTLHTKQPASPCRSAPRGAGAHSGNRLQTGLGPERRVTAPRKGRFSRPGWSGSHSMAGFPNTACPPNSRHTQACENGCSRERVYLLSLPLCELANWAPAGQVSKGWKPVTWRRGPPGCPAQEAPGVSPALLSQANPAPGNTNGVNTSAGHIQDSSVCLMFTSLVFQQEPTPLFAL